MTRTGTDASSMRSTKPIGGAATTADIVAAHKGGQKKQSTAARLNALVDQFQAFYGGLEQDVITEYEQEEDRLTAVERYVLRLQKSLVVEQTRRIEMLSHVEENLKQQFEVVWQRNKTQVEALRPEIPRRIEQWHARLCADEEILEEVRLHPAKALQPISREPSLDTRLTSEAPNPVRNASRGASPSRRNGSVCSSSSRTSRRGSRLKRWSGWNERPSR
jgi:molybdopterin converting factor small subunit